MSHFPGRRPDAGCRVYHSAHQSLANDTDTALAFDSERYDPAGMHDPATNNSRITIGTAGRYWIWALAEFAATAAGGYRQVYLRVNGATIIAAKNAIPTGVGLSHRVRVACEYDFAAGDYIEIMARQNSGGALDVQAVGNYSPEFGARRVA